MTEVDWGTQDNRAQAKKRVPTWVWITGGCCGVAVLGVIALMIGGYFVSRKMMNQEKNWESLAAVVQFDPEVKNDVQIVDNVFGAMMPGVDGLWQLTNMRHGWQTTIVQVDAKTADKLRAELFAEAKSPFVAQMAGALGEHGTEIGTLEVQGRELRVRRFVTEKPDEAAKDADKQESEEKEDEDRTPQGVAEGIASVFKKSCAVFDITQEGTPGLVVVVYAKLGSIKRVSDDELTGFFEPFHIGPNR